MGVSVVNALSEKLELEIYRNGKSYEIEFSDGATIKPLKEKAKKQDRTGTKLTFWASNKVFSQTNYNFEILEKRLRELGFLNSNIKILLEDNRVTPNLKKTFHYSGGLEEFIIWLSKNAQSLNSKPINIKGEKDSIKVELSLKWTDSYNENVKCYTNNIPQRDGGTHLAGLRAALQEFYLDT